MQPASNILHIGSSVAALLHLGQGVAGGPRLAPGADSLQIECAVAASTQKDDSLETPEEPAWQCAVAHDLSLS